MKKKVDCQVPRIGAGFQMQDRNSMKNKQLKLWRN